MLMRFWWKLRRRRQARRRHGERGEREALGCLGGATVVWRSRRRWDIFKVQHSDSAVHVTALKQKDKQQVKIALI